MLQPTEEDTGPTSRIYRIHRRKIPQKEVLTPHFHNDLELVCFEEVAGISYVDGKPVPIGNNCIHCFAPNVVHSFFLEGNDSGSNVIVLQLNLDFFKNAISYSSIAAGALLFERLCRIPVVCELRIGSMQKMLADLEMISGTSSDKDVLMAKEISVLFALLYDLLAQKPMSRPYLSSNAQIRKIMDVISHHIDKHVVLETIACECALSRFHLCRIFKKQTGLTVNDYVTRQRIYKAQQLLSVKGLNVTEACFECGFSSVSHFIATFAKATGATPKQWALRQAEHHGTVTALP